MCIYFNIYAKYTANRVEHSDRKKDELVFVFEMKTSMRKIVDQKVRPEVRLPKFYIIIIYCFFFNKIVIVFQRKVIIHIVVIIHSRVAL